MVYLAFLRKAKVSQNGDVKLFTVAHHERESAGLEGCQWWDVFTIYFERH
jgi:hypothetical protein